MSLSSADTENPGGKRSKSQKRPEKMIQMEVYIRTNVVDDLIGSKLTLHLPEGTCLRGLFDCLVQKYGEQVEERLFTKGRLEPSLTVLVNGRPWSSSDLETQLPQPCEVCIFHILSGG